MVVRAVSSSPEPEPATWYRPLAPTPPPRPSTPGWTWLAIADTPPRPPEAVMTRTLGAGAGGRQTPGQRSRQSIQSSQRC